VDYQKRIYCILNEDTSDFARCLFLNYGEDEPLQLSMESAGDGKYYIFVIIKIQLMSLYFKTIRYLRPYLSILFFIIKFTCYYIQYIYLQHQYFSTKINICHQRMPVFWLILAISHSWTCSCYEMEIRVNLINFP
jgi:hypothetical protein